jgi:hypothetical protein
MECCLGLVMTKWSPISMMAAAAPDDQDEVRDTQVLGLGSRLVSGKWSWVSELEGDLVLRVRGGGAEVELMLDVLKGGVVTRVVMPVFSLTDIAMDVEGGHRPRLQCRCCGRRFPVASKLSAHRNICAGTPTVSGGSRTP